MDLRDIRRVERLIEHKREQIIRMRSIAERVTGGLDVTGIRGTAEREDVTSSTSCTCATSST